MRYATVITLLILCFFQTGAGALEPTLTLIEARRGTWEFTGMLEPPVILDDQVSCSNAILWDFSWSAEANAPGTSVTEYRYGWDIVDPADPLQWEIDWTNTYQASLRTFYFGTHTFMLEARDNTGAVTRATVNLVIETVDAPALTVDESSRGEWEFIGLDGPVVTLVEQLPEGTPRWEMSWYANSCSPGGGIDGYRYGWDIADPGDDEQWTPWGPDTHAPDMDFFAGVHTFMVEAKDNLGVVTRGTIIFEVVPGESPVKSSTWGGIKNMYSD